MTQNSYDKVPDKDTISQMSDDEFTQWQQNINSQLSTESSGSSSGSSSQQQQQK